MLVPLQGKHAVQQKHNPLGAPVLAAAEDEVLSLTGRAEKAGRLWLKAGAEDELGLLTQNSENSGYLSLCMDGVLSKLLPP